MNVPPGGRFAALFARAARVAFVAIVAIAVTRFEGAAGAISAEARDKPEASDAALPAGDWTAIQTTIKDQLTALRGGDASGAFSFAAPGIRERFQDAPAFLRMVRQSYAALLDARYTEFLEGAVIEGRTIQPLRLVMSDDTVLVALYEMQKDERGFWRIAGCIIAPSTVRST